MTYLTVIQTSFTEVQLLTLDLNDEIKTAIDKSLSHQVTEAARQHIGELQEQIGDKLDYVSSLVARAIGDDPKSKKGITNDV